MVKFLYGRVAGNLWLKSTDGRQAQEKTGVLLRKSRSNYVTAPLNISPELLAAVRKINVEVAFTMQTDTIDAVLGSLEPYQSELRLPNGSQLQIVESFGDLMSTSIKKFQYACLIVQEGLLLVWHDDIQQILPHASLLEEKLLSLVKLLVMRAK
jgi:hypothetical protein